MRGLFNRQNKAVLLILLAVFYIYSFLIQPSGLFKQPSLRVNDFFFSLKALKPDKPRGLDDIVVVAIDSNSIESAGLRWPWKRSLFAELLRRISAQGPKVVFFDFTFSGESDKDADSSFAEEIKNAGNVILAGYVEGGKFFGPLDILASSARGIGWVNKKRDDSLFARQAIELFANGPDGAYDYGVEAKLLALYRGEPLEKLSYDNHRIIISKDFSFPAEFGLVPISYSVVPGSFKTIPASKILGRESFQGAKESIGRTENRQKVIAEGDFLAGLFKDKIVMIGMTANISHDIHLTPIGKIPGIYINAYALLTLISGDFMNGLPYAYDNFFLFRLISSGDFKSALPYIANMLIFFSFAFLGGFIPLRFKTRSSFLFLPAIMAGLVLAYSFLVIRFNFRMDIFSLLSLMFISYLAVEIYKYASLILDSEKIKLAAIVDPKTGLYTKRYFQLFAQSLAQKPARPKSHIFGVVHMGEFSGLRKDEPRNLPDLIKALASILRQELGQDVLIAQSSEESLSFCSLNSGRKKAEKSLLELILEINSRDFIVNNKTVKISARCAVVDFPREHIKSYADLALTSDSLLKRVEANPESPLAVFDENIDKIVRGSVSLDEDSKLMPESELGYVSLDLEARNKELEAALEKLKEEQRKNEQYYFQTMHSLVKALEEKDPYTAGHSERVGFYSTELAMGLGLAKKEVEAVNKAAYLHDIGKIGLPDAVLHKKEKLSDEDFAHIKRHMMDGAKILEGLPFLEESVPYILYHHERYDGRGYPHGLSGNMIPRGAQIIAVADSFDAMTTGRGYNKPLMLDEAIGELKKSSGAQLNPVYVTKFIELLEEKKIQAI